MTSYREKIERMMRREEVSRDGTLAWGFRIFSNFRISERRKMLVCKARASVCISCRTSTTYNKKALIVSSNPLFLLFATVDYTFLNNSSTNALKSDVFMMPS